MDLFLELKAQYPHNPSVMADLARIYRLIGKKEEAIQAVDELVNVETKTPTDPDSLNESLKLYEQTVEAFEQDHKEIWERSLSRLSELVRPSGPGEEETLLTEESPLQEEESIPILDFGGKTFSEISEEEEKKDEEETKENLEIYEHLPPFIELPEEGGLPQDLEELRHPPFYTRGTKPITTEGRNLPLRCYPRLFHRRLRALRPLRRGLFLFRKAPGCLLLLPDHPSLPRQAHPSPIRVRTFPFRTLPPICIFRCAFSVRCTV